MTVADCCGSIVGFLLPTCLWYRVEPDGSNLKCRFTPLSVGSHTTIGKKCVVEAAGIGCNVRIDDGCVLVRLRLAVVSKISC